MVIFHFLLCQPEDNHIFRTLGKGVREIYPPAADPLHEMKNTGIVRSGVCPYIQKTAGKSGKENQKGETAMRNIKIAGIVIFCFLLFGCGAVSVIMPQKTHSDLENRRLEQKPELSLQALLSGEYQRHYETYLTDQMFLRDRWVNLAAGMELLAGRKEINGVYIGKDGYLLEAYVPSDYEPARTEENISLLAGFLNYAVRTYGNKHVTCMMVPSKARALPQKLPAFASVHDVADTITALEKQLEYPRILLNEEQTMRDHQQEYIYFRTDHHWTALGAYYAYCDWAEKTGHTVRPLEDYDRETAFTDFYGTTYNKAHIPVPADRVELFHDPAQQAIHVSIDQGDVESDSFYFRKEALEGFNRYNVFFSKNAANIEIHTTADTGKCLLVIKDSFANCFVPFLAEYYDKIIMTDCRYSKENVRKFLKSHPEITDVIVMYNVEKFMRDTNLRLLEEDAGTVEKFDLEDFMS